MLKRVSERHRLVLQEVAIGKLNLEQCWIKFYPKSTKCTADKRINELMKHPIAIEYLKVFRAKVESENVATLQEIQEMLTKVIRGNLGDYVDVNGSVDASDLSSQAVSKFKRVTGDFGTTEEIVLRDPIVAAKELCRLKGWEKPQEVEVTLKTINVVRR